MRDADLRDIHMNLTQIMRTQDQVIANHFVAQANQGGEPQPILMLSLLECMIS